MKYIIINLEIGQEFNSNFEEKIILSIILYFRKTNKPITDIIISKITGWSYKKVRRLIKKLWEKIKNYEVKMTHSIGQNDPCQEVKMTSINNNINISYLHKIYLSSYIKNFLERKSSKLRFEPTCGNAIEKDFPLLNFKKYILDCENLHNTINQEENMKTFSNLKEEVLNKQKKILISKNLNTSNLYRRYILFCSEKGIAYDSNLPKVKVGMLKKAIKFFNTNEIIPEDYFEYAYNYWDNLKELLKLKSVFNFYDLFYNIEEIMTEMKKKDKVKSFEEYGFVKISNN